jgi:protocatechuate 3,4-dioxygenase beta subunit
MKAVALTAVLLLILSAVARPSHAQAPRSGADPSRSGIVISGRVVADDSGDPVRNARVAVTGPQPAPVVLTGPDGRFTFTVPSGGRYIVAASKTGYARREATPAVDGQAIEIRLRRSAAISGRVLDELGDPVISARVAAQTPQQSSAGNAAAVATTDTDDRGEYRLAGLPAGSYVVSVTTFGTMMQVGAGRPVLFAPAPQRAYYPGVATEAEAQALPLQSGEDRRRIDFAVRADRPGLPPVIAVAQQLRAQAPTTTSKPPPAGVVRGRVTSTDGRPVGNAQVVLTGTVVADSSATMTDGDGRFELRDVAAGTFRITANKAGYARVESGRLATPAGLNLFDAGLALELAAGEIRERVDMTLARWGALNGVVSDEQGDPLQGVMVQVLQVRYEAGRRRLAPARAATRVTDDLGRFRIHSLAPGQYIVSAAVGQVQTEDLPGYAPSFYPGTSNPAQAQFVTVGLSQDAPGIDFALSRARTARVAGTAFDPAGQPAMPGTLMLMPSQKSSSVLNVAVGARLSPDGTFEFPNVPPGQYVIQAYRGRSNPHTEGEFGALPVSVNGTDVTGLRLQISTGSAMTGRITFDAFDRTKTATPSAIVLMPIPVDVDLAPNSLAQAEIHQDWTFEIAGLNGPRRLEIVRAPPGWALKEIRVNGIDVTDRALTFGRRDQSLSNVEVVLTDRINELIGTVADDQARPAPGTNLIVFPTDRSRWYPSSRFLRKTTAGPDGAFSAAGLPDGAYYVAAVERVPLEGDDAWQEAAYLDSLTRRASTVTMGGGQKANVALRLSAR